MSEWSAGREKNADPDRIALDSEEGGDLDEALQEAVEAVEAAEAAEAAGRRPAEDADRQPAAEEESDSGTVDAPAVGAAVPPFDPEAETAELDAVGNLRAELDEMRQRSTRTLADFDNFRKRVEREKRAQERYNGMEVLRGLLDIIDNMERALASDGSVDDLKAGVEMTLRQAQTLLQRHGVSRIDADGAAFDPSVHEAVSRLEQAGVDEPTVTAVLQSGYLMHERLLRPVRVAVAVPPVEVTASTDGEEEG